MSNPFTKIAERSKETAAPPATPDGPTEMTARTCGHCGAPRPAGTNLKACAYCGGSFMAVDVLIPHAAE